jgi:uncharacterized protein GlcG (DUF336 family)
VAALCHDASRFAGALYAPAQRRNSAGVYASPIEGSLVISVDGKIIGGIGVSGVNADQDGVVAKAGADAFK